MRSVVSIKALQDFIKFRRRLHLDRWSSVFLYHVVEDLTVRKPEMIEFYKTETVESAIRAISTECGISIWRKRSSVPPHVVENSEMRQQGFVGILSSLDVYALTGGVAPLIPSIDVTHLKRPPPPDEKVAWQWLPIKSSARKDDLQLYHWSVDILKYTDDEYENHLTDPVIVSEVPEIILRCISRDEAALAVAHKAFKALYENASSSLHVSANLAILVAIRDVCKLVKELPNRNKDI